MIKSGNEMLSSSSAGPLMMDRRWKSNIELAPNCPRCASINTKFCYYNNYSLSQPRYFCKSCKRYWTKGGSLRNVPFGGGCRKNRRAKSVRLPPPDRLITTPPNSSFQQEVQHPLPNSGPSPTIRSTRTHASDIDLASVFSKFLNQDSCSDPGLVLPQLPSDIDVSLELFKSANQNCYGAHEHNNMIEWQGLLNPTQDAELIGRLPPEAFLPDLDPQTVGPNPNPNNYGLNVLLSDGVGEDGLWADDFSVTNFPWQSSQLQTLEPNPEEVDHFTVIGAR